MSQIHFIDGEKGGVGKSFFTKALVYHCLTKKLKFYLIDSDRSNPDVHKRHPDISQTIFFSEVEKKSNDADKIFELSLEQPCIVNLPSQIEAIVSGWIERNGLADDLGAQYKLEIYKWFVCTGGHDSITLFIESCEKFAPKIKHVLVQNYFSADEDDWEMIYRGYPKLEEVIKKHNIPCLAFPRLGTSDKNLIDQHQWTFEQTIDKENTEIGALSKQRVVTFLRNVGNNLDPLNIFTPEAFKAHSAKAKKPAA
ncbi:MAG TPA: mobilization protein [Cyanophyceae cyanobacterium]